MLYRYNMLIHKKNITIIIVCYKSDYIVERCLKSIDSNIEVIIVENSNNNQFKEKIENKYKNVKCILSGKNIGMGAANNLALKNIKNDFALILNPDVELTKNTLNKIIEASNDIKNFGILAPILNKKEYPNFKLAKKNIREIKIKKPFKVDSVDGFAMFLNLKRLKKIKNFYFFDENIFLYLENDDLCKRVNNSGEHIYVVPKSKIKHLGGKAVDPKYKNEIELSRNWHWMWSKFYYNKKHFGYFIALIKILNNLISSKIKFIYYLIIFNCFKRQIYQMRLMGLYNSILGNKSYYRPKIQD